jgi:hypothetical protein
MLTTTREKDKIEEMNGMILIENEMYNSIYNLLLGNLKLIENFLDSINLGGLCPPKY